MLRGMNRELKLTCKMSGFTSQKVTSRKQIVKVGTLQRPALEGSRGVGMEKFHNAAVRAPAAAAADQSDDSESC